MTDFNDNMKLLSVEVADTDIKRRYGLMDRKDLPENRGMLFKFPYEQILSFWMSNTYIPLEIAFIDNEGKIFQIEKMIPMSTKPIKSIKKCKCALEVNNGWFKRNNIDIGEKLIGCGFGGDKSNYNLRFAQSVNTDMNIIEQNEQNHQVQEQNTQQGDTGQDVQQSQEVTDSQMNYTIRRRLQRVNAHNRLKINRDRQSDVMVIYQTENGVTLLPRVLRGPFVFVPGASGNLVLANDVSPSVSGVYPSGEKWTCEPGLKTFIIGNILSMQEVNRNNTNQEQEIIVKK